MAKALLVNPLVREWALPNCVPSGLLYLSAVLRRAGHQATILDWNGLRWPESQVERYIRDSDYDLLGIGGIVTTYKRAKWIAAVAKANHPHKPVVVGGPLGTSIPRIILEQTAADAVCIGEGEETILDLLGKSGDLSQVKGIHLRRNGVVVANPARPLIQNLDTIPLPDYANLETLEVYLRNPIGYLNKRKWLDGQPVRDELSLNLISARGCPFSCGFCYSKYLGNKYRTRSVQNVVDEVELAVRGYACSYIHFTDELSFTPQRALSFCDELERRGLEITWGVPFRLDLATRPLLERMRDAGCRHIGCGIESLSPTVLQAMHKKADSRKVKENLALARGIIEDVDTSFIIGYPSETRETLRETMQACREIGLRPSVIFFATPYPGTELYNIALRRGLIQNEVEYIESLGEQGESCRANFTDIPISELMEIKEAWLNQC